MRPIRILAVVCCLLRAGVWAEDEEATVPAEMIPRVNEAQEFFHGGDIASAEKIYRDLLGLEPENVYLLGRLGVALYWEEKYQEAEETLRKAAVLGPRDTYSFDALGWVYAKEEKYDEAEIAFKRASEIDPDYVDAHFCLGMLGGMRNQLETLKKEMETVLALDPDNPKATLSLAVAHAYSPQPDMAKAAEYYQRALALGVERDESFEVDIGYRTETDRREIPPVAKSAPLLALELHDIEAHLNNAVVLTLDAGTAGDAVVEQGMHFDIVSLSLGPATPLHEAITELSATGSVPDVPPELLPLAREAKEQFERGNYVNAEDLYRKILAKAPNNLYTLSNLGVVLFRANKLEQAEESFHEAIAVAPEDSFSHCTLGIVYYSEGKYDAAIDALTKALAIDPKNATAHNYLGITCSQKGWQEAAQKELEMAVTLDAKYADAHFNFAVVLVTKQPTADVVKSRQHYWKALELGAERDAALEGLIAGSESAKAGPVVPPEDTGNKQAPPATANGKTANAGTAGSEATPADATTSGASGGGPNVPPDVLPLAREGKEQFERGNYLEAEKVYRKILVKYPNNLYTLSNLGVVFFRANKLKLSEEALRQAIAVAPDDSFSHCTLGIVYYSEGKYDEAVNELTKTLAIDPKNATAHAYLAITCSQKGWDEAARKELDEAAKLDPAYKQTVLPQELGDFLTPLEKQRMGIPPMLRQ